jgi:hypothetical protein
LLHLRCTIFFLAGYFFISILIYNKKIFSLFI